VDLARCPVHPCMRARRRRPRVPCPAQLQLVLVLVLVLILVAVLALPPLARCQPQRGAAAGADHRACSPAAPPRRR
jgi:hypothetical protein